MSQSFVNKLWIASFLFGMAIGMIGCSHPKAKVWETKQAILLGEPGEPDLSVEYGYSCLRSEDYLEQIKYMKKTEVDLWPFWD